MKRRIAGAAALVALSVAPPSADAAPRYPSHWFACGQHPDHVAAMVEPCSEIDRAVSEAADEFHLDHREFRLLIRCESHFQDRARNGGHEGIAMHAERYWPARVRAFNRANRVDLGRPANRVNPFDSARVTAWMLANGGHRHWRECT